MPKEITAVIRKVLHWSSRQAREDLVNRNREHLKRFDRRNFQIGVTAIGGFQPSHSTVPEIRWCIEKLNYTDVKPSSTPHVFYANAMGSDVAFTYYRMDRESDVIRVPIQADFLDQRRVVVHVSRNEVNGTISHLFQAVLRKKELKKLKVVHHDHLKRHILVLDPEARDAVQGRILSLMPLVESEAERLYRPAK